MECTKWFSEQVEYVGGDGGYWTTTHVNINKPWNQAELLDNPARKAYNKCFNGERELIERDFGFVKRKFRIFASPWRRDKHMFAITLRVALKLCNRFWLQPENMPLGLQKRWNKLLRK